MTKILIDRSTVEQALEALELIVQWDEADLILLDHHIERARGAITALKAALAEPAQEPATLPGPGLVMCPACCSQFDPALNRVEPVQEPVQEPDDEVCDGSRGGRCIHQDPNQCKPERDCPAFSAPPQQRPTEPAQEADYSVCPTCGGLASDPIVPEARRAVGAGGGLAAWGIDWGGNGDRVCVSIVKMLPSGSIEIVDTQYEPPGWRQQKTE